MERNKDETELCDLYFSQSVDKEKADSEQMAVRTAEKLLKVTLIFLYGFNY